VGPDGEVIGGPRTPQQIAAQKRLQQTQAQVDEVCTQSVIPKFPFCAKVKNARKVNMLTRSSDYLPAAIFKLHNNKCVYAAIPIISISQG